MNGILIVDKPAGPTSHDVVSRVRKILQQRQVGHLGTLDPLATGVLPLVVGNFTRLAQFISRRKKLYGGDAIRICHRHLRRGGRGEQCDADSHAIVRKRAGNRRKISRQH